MNNVPHKKSHESPEQRFKRLAEPRVNNVLRTLRILSNLSNTSNYDYSKEQITKIFKVIREQLDVIEKKFDTGTQRVDQKKFKL